MDSKKILIVDDDKTILKVLEISLQILNLQVTTASSAEAAVEKLKTNFFNLIIIDYYLPKIDGSQICQLIRNHADFEKNKNTPVLILSGKMETTEAMLEEVCGFGANDFLAKPFETKDLIEKIKTLVGLIQG